VIGAPLAVDRMMRRTNLGADRRLELESHDVQLAGDI